MGNQFKNRCISQEIFLSSDYVQVNEWTTFIEIDWSLDSTKSCRIISTTSWYISKKSYIIIINNPCSKFRRSVSTCDENLDFDIMKAHVLSKCNLSPLWAGRDILQIGRLRVTRLYVLLLLTISKFRSALEITLSSPSSRGYLTHFWDSIILHGSAHLRSEKSWIFYDDHTYNFDILFFNVVPNWLLDHTIASCLN